MIVQLWDKSEALKLGIPRERKSLFFKWQYDGLPVYFAINQWGSEEYGYALECHVAAEGRAKRKLRTAINQMAQFCFSSFPNIDKIVSYSYKNSMKNMTKKCGFKLIATLEDEQADNNQIELLMRFRDGR